MNIQMKKAREHWKKLRDLAKRYPSPFKGMTKSQIIQKLRKTREQLWEEKIASSLRH